MWHKISIFSLIARLVLTVLVSFPASAQDAPNGWTSTGLNLRIGPGSDYDVIATLPRHTSLILDGRNADLTWVLVHTDNGVFRGWVSSQYVTLREGFDLETLPTSEEIITELAAPGDSAPVMAVVSAWARGELNVYTGPSASHAIIYRLDPITGIVLEGCSADQAWVLGHTAGGSVRGWMDSQYLYLRRDVDLALLPVLSQTIPLPAATATPVPVAAAAPAPASSESGPVGYQGYNQSYSYTRAASIDLHAYPVVPSSLGQARAIFLHGKTRGTNPNVVSKVGDCASYLDYFLKPFGWGGYNLGSYGYLQGVIDHFSGSLTYSSWAAAPGFVAGAVLDSTWADRNACQPGESPLQCEFRNHRPAVAVIMFGTQDVMLVSAELFDSYLRQIVYETIQAGAIPVLSTFQSNLPYWNNTILYNQIVVRVALDYNIPLINLWLALESLPNHGLDPDGNHLSVPISPGSLAEPNLQRGYPMRNLVTLQTLDVIWRNAMY